jgi:hypothetical protein
MSNSTSTKLSRRTVFAGAGVAGAAAAAAALLPTARPAPPVSSAARSPETTGGYQLTEHVQHYYRTTRV